MLSRTRHSAPGWSCAGRVRYRLAIPLMPRGLTYRGVADPLPEPALGVAFRVQYLHQCQKEQRQDTSSHAGDKPGYPSWQLAPEEQPDGQERLMTPTQIPMPGQRSAANRPIRNPGAAIQGTSRLEPGLAPQP